jgi:hypothetical protein
VKSVSDRKGETRRRPSSAPVTQPPDPRAVAVTSALEAVRRARAELEELKKRREDAVRRADAAIEAVRAVEKENGGNAKVRDALEEIERISRYLDED